MSVTWQHHRLVGRRQRDWLDWLIDIGTVAAVGGLAWVGAILMGFIR